MIEENFDQYNVLIPEKVEYEPNEYIEVEIFTEGGIDFYHDDLVNDFYIFCCYMFARAGFGPPTKIQKMIIDFIIKPSEKDKLLQAPRGAGKSYISQLFVLWNILRDNDNHILVRSASSKRSRNYTTFLLNLIKQTPLLWHMAPTNKHRKSSELFDVNGAVASDSPTVLSAGISGTVTGLRATKCILDDVEVIANASTPETRETLEIQVNENYNLLVESNGISGDVLVLGTFQTSNSIYLPMIKSGSFDYLIIPAEYPPINEWYSNMVPDDILKVSKANPDMIGKAIDERLNDAFLKKRKLRAGKSNYELHYMLNPNLSDSLKFPLKMKDLIITDIDDIDNPIRYVYGANNKIKELKHRGFPDDFITGPAWVSDERAKFDFTILAIDPSGRGTDETGWFIVSIMGGKLFIRNFGGLIGGYEDEALDELVSLSMQYNINASVIESNFGDGAYAKMLESKYTEANFPVQIEEIRAVTNKEGRIISTLEPLLNQHRIVVDRKALENDYYKKANYSFTYQLTHMQNKARALIHDDIIDTCELACAWLIEYMVSDEHAMKKHAEQKAFDYEKFMKEGLFPDLRKKSKSKNFKDNY